MGYGTSGNGNGFKIGSSKTGIRHLVQNNVAWSNSASGFYANHSTGGNTWYNNTSYNNGTQYNMLASSFDASGNVTGTIILTGTKVHIMRNNIGFPDKNSNMEGSTPSSIHGTWGLPRRLPISPACRTLAAPARAKRMAACRPHALCMHLAAGSQMIDKGTNVGLPYVGSAPDLGAYEYGATTTTGSGGTTGGAGGSTGSGGTARALAAASPIAAGAREPVAAL